MAIMLYKLAANQGYYVAQFSLGICYENGEGVEKDNNKFDVGYLKGLEGAREVPLN